MSSLKHWIWLSSLCGIGPVTTARLLRRFGTPESVFRAQEDELHDIEGVRPADIAKLANKDVSAANKILAACAELRCRIITLQDAEYPERLRNIYDPPAVLYALGCLPIIDEEPVVAVVGTRECTPYGLSSAESISNMLSNRGIIVTTGMARGVDTAAARGALRGGGRVIGVVGSGLDIVYPPENKALFDAVACHGAIISEYPPGTPAVRAHFPARNRILSGISLGVAVIEAPRRSGALITASKALEQGRDVFTLPGNVDARSCEGSNALLREGAIPILSGEDIISEYADLFPEKISPIAQEEAQTRNPEAADQSDAPPGAAGSAEHGMANPETAEQSGAPPGAAGSAGHGMANPEAADQSGAPPGAAGIAEHGAPKKEIDNTPAVDYIDLSKILAALSGDGKTVAEAIGVLALHTDDIIVSACLPAQKVLTALTMLEIDGYAARCGNGQWKLTAPSHSDH